MGDLFQLIAADGNVLCDLMTPAMKRSLRIAEGTGPDKGSRMCGGQAVDAGLGKEHGPWDGGVS